MTEAPPAEGAPQTDVFSPGQLEEFKEAFTVFDKDADGRITPQEMCGLLGATGFQVSQAEVTDYCSQIDTTGENLFDYNVFLKVAENFNNGNNTQEILSACMRIFFGESTKISTDELKSVLTTLGNPLTPDEMKHLMFNVNPENDETITVADFVNKIAGVEVKDDEDDQ
ncbi:EF hand family protein [Trichomonas vaginalis G3]|uniref:EF hand family protein n=1 Tax=Trichomonas vaginalis (strain ATCC PRA-98 / G3) TaxID=412133 RepID=A2EBG2_TRIV3|nr:calcium-binding protein family [Trichomonas vaginalis G3]EAY09992.1 EF hand family protein [Trichomonas vaginalis G3]KAI5535072.1 calcium-binding protein family [Trichomonas vaginalis G3]|eukprot:XP_001322215.1 EF hand family protein [Trichomonas vaginalis G3]